MKLISTDEAAERLGISGRRIRQLIDEGKLQAQYVGGGYVIEESALESVKVYGKPGRPPKPATAAPPNTKSEIRRADKTAQKLNEAFRKATEDEQQTGKKRGKK
jgi:excisionase family DNA binding protein